MKQVFAEAQNPFTGCKLSVQLNGLNVLTIEEGSSIKELLSIIAKSQGFVDKHAPTQFEETFG